MLVIQEELASGWLTRGTQVQGARRTSLIANFVDHCIVDWIKSAKKESADTNDGRKDEHFGVETEEC